MESQIKSHPPNVIEEYRVLADHAVAAGLIPLHKRTVLKVLSPHEKADVLAEWEVGGLEKALIAVDMFLGVHQEAYVRGKSHRYGYCAP